MRSVKIEIDTQTWRRFVGLVKTVGQSVQAVLGQLVAEYVAENERSVSNEGKN